MAARGETGAGAPKSGWRVELDELSGPVSPRYQYRTRIVVVKGAKGATLSYDHEGVFSGGAPTETRKAKVAVRPEDQDALWAILGDLGEDAPVPEDTKARVGVSVSTLVASRGGKKMLIEYTRAELKKPAGANKKALVEGVKSWAEALIGAPAGEA